MLGPSSAPRDFRSTISPHLPSGFTAPLFALHFTVFPEHFITSVFTSTLDSVYTSYAKTFSQRAIQRTCTAAANAETVLAYRVAIPHLPYSGGKSRHGAPVRNIQKTALINRRLSFATPPHCPLCPGRRGSSKAHASSVMSCRRCEFSTRAPPYTVLFLYLKTRVDII